MFSVQVFSDRLEISAVSAEATFTLTRSQLVQFVDVVKAWAVENEIYFSQHHLDNALFTYLYPEVGTYSFECEGGGPAFFSGVYKHITSLKYLARNALIKPYMV